MQIETEHLFTLRLKRDAERAIRIKNSPHGDRAVAPAAAGGTFEGERLRGELLGRQQALQERGAASVSE